MEDGSSSPTPTHSSNTTDPIQTSDSDEDTQLYNFSDEEISYNSDEQLSLLNPPLHKRPKNSDHQNPDLISSFPDSVLLHVISFLPAEDAVATSLLSNRWRHLWTAVPTLLFRLWTWRSDPKSFVDFVSQTLRLYSYSAQIKKFHLDFEFHKRFKFAVDGWLRFATRHHVEELHLDFYESYGELKHYTIPQFIYSYGMLKKLNLSFCMIRPSGSINWKHLKSLCIGFSKLSDDLVEEILMGSPVLDSLEFHNCSGVRHLNVGSSSLRKLVVNNWDSWDDVVLEISGPNLKLLVISGFLCDRKCRVRNVSSLVDVTLNFQLLCDLEVDLDHNHYEEYQNMLREILENIGHVKKLVIGQWCIQVLSICQMRDLPSPMSEHNYLMLNTCLNGWDLPGIASLLHCTPDLETLIVNIKSPFITKFEFDANSSKLRDFNVEKYLSLKSMNFKNSLLSLKTVKVVVGFIAEGSQCNFLIALLEFLLKNASMLERMVICAFRPEILDIMGQRLLNFPRSSLHAEILLKT